MICSLVKKFSIGVHEAAEYIETPVLQHVPLTPEYCKNIIFWHDMIVPVIDMNILLGNSATTNYKHVMVIAYQHKEHTPLAYAAFILASALPKLLLLMMTHVNYLNLTPKISDLMFCHCLTTTIKLPAFWISPD